MVDANGTCKHCYKGVCSSCGSDSGNGLCCSETCKSELLSLKDITEKSKMLYGQRGGRFPIVSIMTLSMGSVMTIHGILTFQSGRGYLGIVIGGIFLLLGILSLINQRRTGIRS